MLHSSSLVKPNTPWNKGKLIGQKPPLQLPEIWAIRVRLQIANNRRDLALFNLAIDSKLRSCDLVKLKVSDISHGSSILKRAMVIQQKTSHPVRFEITQQTREALASWIDSKHLAYDDYLLLSRTELYPRGSTTELLNRGYLKLACRLMSMLRTRYAEQRLR